MAVHVHRDRAGEHTGHPRIQLLQPPPPDPRAPRQHERGRAAQKRAAGQPGLHSRRLGHGPGFYARSPSRHQRVASTPPTAQPLRARASPAHSVVGGEVPEGGRSPPPSYGQIRAAVGVDELAGDEDRVLGGEEDGHPRDLLGLGHAAERDLPRARRDLLLGIAVAGLLRVGQAGGDGVDADAMGGQRQGHRAGHAEHARLAGRVVHAARVAADRGGRDVDDRAGLARRHHRARRRLGAEEAALEVHGEHVIPLRLGQLEERGAREDARVVDEDVGRAQLRGRRRQDGRDVLAPRDVARDDHRLAAVAPDLGGHALRGRAVIQEVDADVGAVASQRDGDGPADALLRARDERHSAAESHADCRDEEREAGGSGTSAPAGAEAGWPGRWEPTPTARPGTRRRRRARTCRCAYTTSRCTAGGGAA